MILLVIFILLLIFKSFLMKKKISGLLLFNSIWLITSFLLLINPYKTDQIEYNTIFIFILGILFFNIGTLVKFNKNKIPNVQIKNIKLKYFYIYYTGLTLINFYYLFKTIPKIIKYGFYYVKGAAYSIEGYEALYGSTKIAMFMDLYVSVLGTVSFLILLGVLLNFKNSYKIKVLLLISILNKVLEMIYTGSRLKVVNIVILIFLYLLYCEKLKLKQIVLTLVLLIPFYIVTSITSDGRVLEQIVIYLTGSLIIFDKFMNSSQDFWYGKMLISTFEYPISLGLRFFSKSYTPILSEYYSEFSNNIYIGNKYLYNALYTIFHPFYLDFGVLGVILNSFFYGLLYKYIYSKFKITKFRKIIIVYVDLYVVLSIFKNNFINFNIFLTIILLMVSVIKIEKSNKIKNIIKIQKEGCE